MKKLLTFARPARSASPLLLLLLASPGGQAAGFSALCTAYNQILGGNSELIAFVAGVAVVIFFVVLALNEGNGMVSWGIKILIGISGLIGAGALLKTLFPSIGASCF